MTALFVLKGEQLLCMFKIQLFPRNILVFAINKDQGFFSFIHWVGFIDGYSSFGTGFKDRNGRRNPPV